MGAALLWEDILKTWASSDVAFSLEVFFQCNRKDSRKSRNRRYWTLHKKALRAWSDEKSNKEHLWFVCDAEACLSFKKAQVRNSKSTKSNWWYNSICVW